MARRKVDQPQEFNIHFNEVELNCSYDVPAEVEDGIPNCQYVDISFDDCLLQHGAIVCHLHVEELNDDPCDICSGDEYDVEEDMEEMSDGTYQATLDIDDYYNGNSITINVTVDRFLDIPNYNMKSQNIKLNGFLFRKRR